MEKVNTSSSLVCIHDAARPFVDKVLIENCIKECDFYDGSIVATKSTDTVKFSQRAIPLKKQLIETISGWPKHLRFLINKS